MKKILVVDDAKLNRELLQDMLNNDYIVETAADGAEALKKLSAYQDEISALLLDLRMPVLDGFGVIREMKYNNWMKQFPVLIISSENAVEIETQCLELGVSDFIHKPFESSIVKHRVKNAIELFTCKNQLEQTVAEQAKTLKKQYQIIQMQAEQLREAKPFSQLMMDYRSAIVEVETKLKVLNAEFSQEYNRNPFESIKSRLKSPESIYEKLERKPSIDKLVALADIFHVSTDYILGRTFKDDSAAVLSVDGLSEKQIRIVRELIYELRSNGKTEF